MEKKKLKKGVKIVLIIIGVILLLFAGLIGIEVYKDMQIEKKLNKEIQEIQNIMDATEFDEEKFKNKLNNTVSDGDYYKVERAYKNYLRDYLSVIYEIKNFYNDLDYENILTIDTIKEDGPGFVSSKLYVNNAILELGTLKVKFNNFSDEEKVLSYLDKKVDKYYVEYFKTIIGDVSQSNTEKELSNELEKTNTFLDNVLGILNYLSKYKDYWYISSDKLYFTDEEILNQYNDLLENVNTENIDTESSM